MSTFTSHQVVSKGQTITVILDRSIKVPDSISKDTIIITTSQANGGLLMREGPILAPE